MADAMNDYRALRLTQILEEFRSLQYYIAYIEANPTPEEYYGEGYVTLRECIAEAQAILAKPFTEAPEISGDDPEQVRAQLAHVILDASARRFQAQKVYLRVTAAMRWINSRNAVLQGQPANESHAYALHTVDEALRNELAAITDDYVVMVMRSHDQSAGRWVDEDPSVAQIQYWLATN